MNAMVRLLILQCILLLHFNSIASTIIVKNIDELNEASKKAQPGDLILLYNGEWNNVTIKLDCNGRGGYFYHKKAPSCFRPFAWGC